MTGNFHAFLHISIKIASIKGRNCYMCSLIYRKPITILKDKVSRRAVVSIEQSEEKQ